MRLYSFPILLATLRLMQLGVTGYRAFYSSGTYCKGGSPPAGDRVLTGVSPVASRLVPEADFPHGHGVDGGPSVQ